MFKAYPAVSCIMPTYGRPRVAEEALESFLRQNYQGEKELIIWNDYDQQTLKFDHPQVKVINTPTRFRSLGEKRNFCVFSCSYEHIMVWDDDDIHLPHRIAYSIEKIQHRPYFKGNRAFVLNGSTLSGPHANAFHGCSLWTKAVFEKAGRYPVTMDSGEDRELEIQIGKHLDYPKNYEQIPTDEIYYIYRWGGTGSYHLSAFGENSHETNGARRVAEYVARTNPEKGVIELKPHWKMDYMGLVKNFLHSLESARPESRK